MCRPPVRHGGRTIKGDLARLLMGMGVGSSSLRMFLAGLPFQNGKRLAAAAAAAAAVGRFRRRVVCMCCASQLALDECVY